MIIVGHPSEGVPDAYQLAAVRCGVMREVPNREGRKMSEHKSRGHFCVDYCQPPEHSDLCFSGCERDEIGNHLVFESDYWHLYRVVVTKVRRLPELDGSQNETGQTRDGKPIKQIPIRQGDTIADKAFEVRWRGDLQREPNRFKRLEQIRAIYRKENQRMTAS